MKQVASTSAPLEPVSSPLTHSDSKGVNTPVAEPEQFDLETLAREAGQLAKPAAEGGKFLWKHNVASFLHGWGQHEYHQNCKVTLTRAEYKAALDAVDTQTTHGPAERKADKA